MAIASGENDEAGKGMNSSKATSFPVQKEAISEKLGTHEYTADLTASESLTTSKESTTATSSKKEEHGSSSTSSLLGSLSVQKEAAIAAKDSEERKSTSHSSGQPKSSLIQQEKTCAIIGREKLKEENNRFLQGNKVKVTANVEMDTKDKTGGGGSDRLPKSSLPVEEKSTDNLHSGRKNTILAPPDASPAQTQNGTIINNVVVKDMNCSPKQPKTISLPIEEEMVNHNNVLGDGTSSSLPSTKATILSMQSSSDEGGTVKKNSGEKASNNNGSHSIPPKSMTRPVKEMEVFKNNLTQHDEENCSSSSTAKVISSPSPLVPLQEKDGEGSSREMAFVEEKISSSCSILQVQKENTGSTTSNPVVEEENPKGGNSKRGSTSNSNSSSPLFNTSVPTVQVTSPPQPKNTSFADGIEFPNSVAYYIVKNNVEGDSKQSCVKLRKGDIALVMKAEDPNFWLIKVGDDIGWAMQKDLTKVVVDTDDPQNSKGADRTQRRSSPESDGMEWEYKKEGFMSASDVNSVIDIELTMSRTFEHEGSKVTAFFIQVSATRKGAEPNQGEIWVISKTLKAFNRLRVAWEEDFGSRCIPYESPHVRWNDCSEAVWNTFRCSCIKEFLNQISIRPELKNSKELHHFLTTYTVDLSGGIVTHALMKPYLDIWVRTSSEPSWTVNIAPVPSSIVGDDNKKKILRKVSSPMGMATDGRLIKQTIPGLKPGDESFGKLTSQRPRVLRSDTFAQISALAAVTKQEALLDYGRRTWVEDSVKVKLLTQGGRRSIIRRRSDKNVYNSYYNDGGEAKALEDKGSFNQMRFETRFNLEKIMYGRMDNLSRDSTTKYAAYASNLKKEEEKQQSVEGNADGMGGSNKAKNISKVMNRRSSLQNRSGHIKKNTQFVLEALVSRLDKIQRTNDIQTSECINAEGGFEMCQYMSKVSGRFTMVLPAQLMALQEMTAIDLERWITVKWPVMGAANTYHRLKEIETFLERRRVYVRQLLDLVDQGRTQEEVLLMSILCCSRLIDAVEAEEEGLWSKLSTVLDALNLRRCKLIVSVMAAEARSEEASRGSRKSAREVHADVQRSRKALNFVTKAVTKIRSGDIQRDKFDQLRERLDAAADAAHEEYRDAVRDAKPSTDFAEEAIKWMESCESLYDDLEELGTIIYENIKEVQGAIDDSPEKQDMVLAVIQENIEVTLQMASNARDLASRAADNARFDMQTSLEELSKVEKIIRRVELEERRARNECDAMEGHPADEDLPSDCPYATWSADMREMMQRNLRRFRKAAQYRQCCNNDGQCSGARDLLLMQVLLAKVQVIRDVKKLQEAKKVSDQLKEHEKNVKASKVKVGGVVGTKKIAAGKSIQSSIKSPKEARTKLKIEMEAVDEVLNNNNMVEDDLSVEEGNDAEGDEESLLGSDLDSYDDDAGQQPEGSIIRKKRSTAATLTPKQLHGTYVKFRRQHEMRSSLIRDSLGKGRVSIGCVSKVETIRPITPGSTVRKGVTQTFSEEVGCNEVA